MKWLTSVLLASLAVGSVRAAFRIDASDLAPPPAILGPHQELVKTWTVLSDDVLEKLHVVVVGPVVIRYDPSLRTPSTSPDESGSGSGSGFGLVNTTTLDRAALPLVPTQAVVARIVVSGNGTDLLDAVTVSPLNEDKSNGLRIHLRNDDRTVRGYIQTEIYVADPDCVQHLVTSGASTVVTHDRVLLTNASDARVRLSTSGSGQLLVDVERPVALQHLDLDVTGSGLLQVQAPSLDIVRTLRPSLAGRGVLAIHSSSVRTSELETTLSGSGAFYLDTDKLNAVRIQTSVYGDANASYYVAHPDPDAVQKHRISVAGSGKVWSGSVRTLRTKVSIRGAAQVYVAASDELEVDAAFSGDVFYVGPEPKAIRTRSWFWRTPLHAVTHDVVVRHDVVPDPPEVPEYVAIRTRHALFSSDPNVKELGPPQAKWGWNQAQTMNLRTLPKPEEKKETTRTWWGFVVVGALGVVVWKIRGRNARRQYQPLV